MKKIDIYLNMIEDWKSHNIDGVLGIMADDIVMHYAAGIEPPITGKEKAKKFLEGYASWTRNVDWRVFSHAENENQLFVEGVDEFDTTDGNRIYMPYMGIYDFRDDKVTGWREYFDFGRAKKLIDGEPVTDFVVELVSREAISAGAKT